EAIGHPARQSRTVKTKSVHVFFFVRPANAVDFEQQLHKLGWSEGQNLLTEYRSVRLVAPLKPGRMPERCFRARRRAPLPGACARSRRYHLHEGRVSDRHSFRFLQPRAENDFASPNRCAAAAIPQPVLRIIADL